MKSKLNGGNSIRAINSWAVPVIRYTAGIMDWTQAELEDLDRKTRKFMTANLTLHPQSDVDRLYLPRQTGGQRTAPSKTDCGRRKASIQWLHQKQYRKLSEGSYQRRDTKSARNQKGIPQARNKNEKRKIGKVKRCMVSTSKTSREKWTVTTPGTGWQTGSWRRKPKVS